MPNDIPQKQNSDLFIDRIAASSRAYGIVKATAGWQTFFVVSSAIAGPLLGYLYPDQRHWAIAYVIAVLVIEFALLDPRAKAYQELGAKIQETFDIELFGLPWNKTRCHATLDPEMVHGLAREYKRKNSTTRFIDWYPTTAGSLPIEFGRLVCQRANMVWDASLRRYYSSFFLILIVAIIVASVAVATYLNWNASHILTSLAIPLLPATIKIYREYKKHQDSAAISEKTKSMLEATWGHALSGSVSPAELLNESRQLQDQLYDRRRSSPTVPEWIYFLRLFENERGMRFGSNEMVKQAKEKLGIE